MGICLSAVVILLFAGQEGQQPLGVRVPAGQRGDDLLLVAEEVFQTTVSEIVDGDSVVVQDLGKRVRLRLHGVDAPELSQPFGREAHAFLTKLITGKTITVRRRSRSRAGAETIARLEADGADVSAALISSGLAWHCGRFAENRDLAIAQQVAKDGKRGLWQDATPTPPWKHRGAAECWEDDKGR